MTKRERRAVAIAALGAAIVAAVACGDDSSDGTPDGAAPDGGSSGAGATGGAGGVGGSAAGGGTSGSGGSSGASNGGSAGVAGAGGNLDGWTPVAWNPDWCTIYQADDPSKALPPEKWLPCDNGIAGCVYLDTSQMVDIPQSTNHKLGKSDVVVTDYDAVVIGLNYIYGPTENASAVYEIGKGPLAAWRGEKTDACLPGGLVASTGHFALRLIHKPADDHGSRVAYGALSPAPSIQGTVDVEPPTVGPLHGVLDVETTSTLMAFQLFAPADIAVTDYPPTQVEMIPKPGGGGGQHVLIAAKGSELIFYHDTNPDERAIRARKADGTLVTLYTKPSVYIGEVQGDTERIVWQEPSAGGNALYTALWTTDPASFSPVKVRDLPLGPAPGFLRAAYAGGWFVYWQNGDSLRAIRVTDGKYVDVPTPEGFWWSQPYGAYKDEIYGILTIPPGTGNSYSFARVPIASLGTPKD